MHNNRINEEISKQINIEYVESIPPLCCLISLWLGVSNT